MNTRIVALVLGAFLVASSRLCLADIEPVSFVDPAQAGSASANGYSGVSEVSLDGRYVVFESIASNLTTNDYNYCADVFLRDRQSGTTLLISATPDGFSGNGGSFNSSMSANGAWIAFESDADDLADGDTNGAMDVFVRNTTLGLTALVSVNTNGTSANAASTFPMITPDGRFIAFESAATDLVTNDVATNVSNVYLRDLVSNTTVLASMNTNGTGGGNGNSWLSGVSEDGRYVLFTSAANNLGSTKGNGSEIFLRDMQTQFTYWISTNVAQLFRSDFTYKAWCFNPVMSADGQSLAFRVTKGATNLVLYHELTSNTTQVISSNQLATYVQGWDNTGPVISDIGGVVAYVVPDTSPGAYYMATNQIYVWDITDRTNMLATLAADGVHRGNANSDCPVLSANGSTLAFLSEATNLVENAPATSRERLHVRNLASGTTRLISLETNLDKPPGDVLECPALSADGCFVAFGCSSDGLVDNDNNGMDDVFVGNTLTGINELVSSRSPVLDFTIASGGSFIDENGLSSEGRFAVFSTFAENMVPGDTNNCWDIFVRDMLTKKLVVVSGNTNGVGTGNGSSMKPSISADGNWVAFQSESSDLVAGDTNKTTDVFLRNLATKETRLVSTAYGSTGSAKGASDCPVITPDGRFVIFRSRALNLTSTSVSSYNYSLYVFDTATGTNLLVSFNQVAVANPTELAIAPNSQFAAFVGTANTGVTPFYVFDFSTQVTEKIVDFNSQTHPLSAFSIDGRWLAYVNAVASRSNNVVLRDLVAKTNSTIGVDATVWKLSINGDGSRVAYDRFGTASMPTNKHQIFVYDAMLGSNILVSANLLGTNGGNDDSRNPILSPDGRHVYFNSQAKDLVEGVNKNYWADVCVRDLNAGTTRLLSVNRFKTGSGTSQTVLKALSADGQVVAMESLASDLVAMDLNMAKDVFVLRMNASVEDADTDGLPDSWENQYFGSLERDGTGDFDGDGMSDSAELLAGTDPTDKNSALRMMQVGETSGLGRLVTWAAVPGKTYKVQFKGDLNAATWMDLEGNVKADAAVASKSDNTADGLEQRFYRVVLVE